MKDQRRIPAPATDPSFVLRFQDNREPAINAGLYRIRASQTLPGVDTGDYLPTEDAPVGDVFEVRAPQFALADELVHAAHPVAESRSDYSTTLAHVTLTDPLLPWMRRLDESGSTTSEEAEEPWLALLLFAEGELPGDPDATATTVTMTAQELLAPAEGVRRPSIDPDQIEGDPTAPCQAIEIPGDVFATVVPRTDELRHLIHVRDVRTDRGLRGETLAEGTFSIVVTNRLPDRERETRYAAHLVALEGCRSILDDADAGELTADVRIRLAALHSWSFISSPDLAGGFPGRVQNLLFDESGTDRDLLLRVPTPPADPPPGADHDAYTAARDRLASGHVSLAYGLETGERTYAWYRGPFTAEPAQPLPAPPAAGWTSAAQLTAYEQAWGLFDTGWGAAWTLGRALALADADFAAMLTAWHAKARAQASVLAQRLTAVGLDFPGHGDPQPRSLTHRPFGTLFEELAADGSVSRLLRASTHPEGAGGIPSPEPFPRTPTAGRLGTGRSTSPSSLLGAPPPLLRAALIERLSEDAVPISAWLQRLRLMQDIPFAALVPDERALPVESLRLFYVDPGWVTALVSGATGIAITGETDAALARIAAPWAAPDGNEEEQPTPRAGLLIRSALVQECPGLLVRPYQNHGDDRTPITVLRQDTLGPDVLLVLFEDVPDEIELSEPPEGLSFGVDLQQFELTLTYKRVVNLRNLDDPETGRQILGESFPSPLGNDGLDRYLRPDPAGVRALLDLRPGAVDGLLHGLADRLAALGQEAAAGFGPAGLALQLTNTPRFQLITRERS
ncbi:hypothetical protein ACFYN3_28135 [Streptomyces lavendulae]|uniref:hypothetical protein n=1 Tax=Streptomyces lavendulae TaxID=1914 RepID=UPI0036A78586